MEKKMRKEKNIIKNEIILKEYIEMEIEMEQGMIIKKYINI